MANPVELTILIEKIKAKTAVVGVIGLGYVGLPLAVEFCKAGFRCIGFDIDEKKVNLLKEGKSYIKHIDEARIKTSLPLFTPTSDFSRLTEADCIIICVPTPLGRHHEPDLSYVLNTTRTIAQYISKGKLVVLESTTYPGTTDEEMKPILEAGGSGGLRAGEDFYLAFSPEREDPNNKDFSTSTIPKVVGGLTPQCLLAAQTLYDYIVVRTIPVSSTKVAEATKLLENIYRAVNIALVNELKVLFDKMGIDIWEVIEAAKTKPFGYQPFYPGPGLGGHCIPIDPFYLEWKAREYEVSTKFINLAGEVNTSMPQYVIQKTIDALSENGKSIKGAKVLILGMSYKKDLDDTRESPSLKLFDILQKKGAVVDYNDPYLPEMPKTRKYSFKKTSVALTAENLSSYDCVLISTDHSAYDPVFIASNSRLVVDTRNLIKDSHKYKGKIIKA
ncbi:nucleotide sugar dehydrogenase [Candidatus Magnetominusculus xianensis]|uniref:UDP-N-acetyl-D-glucosamine 6-dehydrogenase n=1 Tax=Candidatus Magnetominusculus xianensis TaxID=1748249 RepID=A0ABR5SFK6_9BACT|nr:nucleotide sugar dehydrogenase [Candidatus Magnetominusculus xianensis]KWT84061.1 UDP-N-acetyl-D-glucosamine 6-dehydrogenase [Candidatus Magnetominusculus xianensis]MBF0402354.1 nucleotide sugar dehydrogenase [Nitrospirota bacterium]